MNNDFVSPTPPGGTLKIKTARFLRPIEAKGDFPMIRIGKWYLIWWRGV